MGRTPSLSKSKLPAVCAAAAIMAAVLAHAEGWQVTALAIGLTALAGLGVRAAYLEMECEFARRKAAAAEALWDASPAPALFWALDGECVYANSAFVLLTGLPMDRLRGQGWVDAVHRADRGAILGQLESGLGEFDAEFRIVRSGGAIVWARCRAARARTGGPAEFVGVWDEISPERDALLEVAATLERYELAHSGSSDGIWDWDIDGGGDGGGVYFSSAARELFGYFPADKMPGLDGLVWPDDLGQVKDALRRHLRDREPFDIESRIPIKAGQFRWLRARGSAMWNGDGRAVRMAGSLSDITERKTAEERLRVSLEGSGESMWDWSIRSGAMYISSELGEQLDIEGAIAGTGYYAIPRVKWEEAIHPEDLYQMRLALDPHMDGTYEIYDSEHRMRGAGGWLWVKERGRIVERDAEGRPARLSGTLADISHQKNLEQELIRAMEQADSANKAKSEFLATMSHEIRTPMNGVIGMTSLLLATSLDAEQREFAETVRSSAEALLTLLNDILDFSKIEAGRLDIETIDFDLRTSMEESIELFADRAAAKALELTTLFPPDLPERVAGDPGRTRQVLLNLIGNAVKFTETGEVTVRAGVESREGEFAVLRFEVHDTGIGISREAQSRLFKSFSQADSATSRKYGGTGLGLAICRRLVELMGGSIGVESEAGQGSTFWFTIRVEPRPALAPPPPPAELRGVRVLGIDDNPNCQTLYRYFLESWGARIDAAENANLAFERITDAAKSGDPYLAVLYDAQLEGTTNWALISRLHEAARCAGATELPRVVAVSSAPARGQAAMAEQHGARAYLVKPFRQSQLRRTLLAVLGAGAPVADKTAPIITRRALTEEDQRRKCRILVAEDNLVNQKLASRVLEKMGFRVDVAGDGAGAVEAVRDGCYALVLMDCQMPVLDGYAATGQIRALPEPLASIPVIAMTANAMDGDRQRCIDAGMNDYLAKPLRLKDLEEKLAQWLPSGQAEPVELVEAAG